MSAVVSILQLSILLWRNISSGSPGADVKPTTGVDESEHRLTSLCHSWSQNVSLTCSSPAVFCGLWKREWTGNKRKGCVTSICVYVAFTYEDWPGELRGDLMKASGLGATGWTGLVCLAANFFRLTLLLSNMSCIDNCFRKTLSTWSWWRQIKRNELKSTRLSVTLEKSCVRLSDPELLVEHQLKFCPDVTRIWELVLVCVIQVSLQLLKG